MLEVSKTAYNVPVSLIIVGQNQRQADNKGFTEASLGTLADSIQRDGLTSPLTLQPLYRCVRCGKTAVEHGVCCGEETALRYMLVAGERRCRSITTFLKWETIPAFIEEMDDTRARAVMAHENIGRVNLNPMEEAAGRVTGRGSAAAQPDQRLVCSVQAVPGPTPGAAGRSAAVQLHRTVGTAGAGGG